MSDTASWLDSLGLSEYTDRFAEQAVDLSTARELNQRDLEVLGIRVGHQKVLLRAIGDLKAAVDSPPSEHVKLVPERRQVTLLFCDLQDSVRLADPHAPYNQDHPDWLEGFRDLISSFHQCVKRVITAHGGHVAERRGDGDYCYFGYPRAHEDDAARAISAAIELVGAATHLRSPAGGPVQIRVTLTTGVMVLGPQGDPLAPWDSDIVGHAANLAARMQALATSGDILVCQQTRSLAGGHFEYQELGEHEFKGITKPESVWKVVRRKLADSLFHATHEEGLPALIGREEESKLLADRWTQVVAGEAKVVLITGEPGIGKSHLAQDLMHRVVLAGGAVQRIYCSEHQSHTTLHPFLTRLLGEGEIVSDDSVKPEFDQLHRILSLFEGLVDDHRTSLRYLTDLLGLEAEGGADLIDQTPQRRKDQALAALATYLEASTRGQPTLILFEDIHWLDSISLEVLMRVIERMPSQPRTGMLLVLTARTEFASPWPSYEHVSTMVLRRLSIQQAAALVTRVAGETRLSDATMRDILLRSETVPLFIEEMTKAVKEGGRLSMLGDRHDGVIGAHVIPGSLQTSLTARLDRLGTVKEIAQIGALAGREFDYGLLKTVSGWPADRLTQALQRLVKAQLVNCRGEDEQAIYQFKHALVREAAMSTLLKRQRLRLHSAVAKALELQADAGSPEAIAEHYAQAEQYDHALRLWLRAGRGATRRGASEEAATLLRRALDAQQHLAGDGATDGLELEILIELAPCLIATQGPASAESIETFDRARALCGPLSPAYAQVMFWFAIARVVRGELEEALKATLAVLRAARRHHDVPAQLNAKRGRGMIQLFMGRIPRAIDSMRLALEAFKTADDVVRLNARSAGQDAGAAGLALMSWALWIHGDVGSAIERSSESLARAQVTRHPHSEAYASYYAAVLHALQGEWVTARVQAERCQALARVHGFRQWVGLSRAMLAICACVMNRESLYALDDVDRALDEYRSGGYHLGTTVLCALLCAALPATQSSDAAIEAIDRSLAIAERTGERVFEAELFRLKARAAPSSTQAFTESQRMAWLEHALSVARAQGALSFELRAAFDLATLLIAHTRIFEASQLLEDVLDRSGKESPSNEAHQARALLARCIGSRPSTRVG